MPARSRWPHGTTAARALLAGLVAIVLVVLLAEPAFADPSDQPGGTSGGLHTPTFRAPDSAVEAGMRAMSRVIVDALVAGAKR